MGNGSQVEAQIKVDVPRECTNVFQHLNKSYAAMSEAAAKEVRREREKDMRNSGKRGL